MYKLIGCLDNQLDRVWCVAWSPQGKLLATCGTDKSIRIYSANSDFSGDWKCKSVLNDAHTRTVRSVAFSPCGRYLVSASFDSTVVIWEKKEDEFEVISTLEGHENEVKSVAFSPSGRYLASCSRDKSVWIWEMDEDDEFQCCSILNAHSQDVKQVVWKRNEDILVSVSYDNSINVYKFDGDEFVVEERLEQAHSSTVWSASFNADDSLLATCSDDATLKIWQNSKDNPTGARGNWRCCSTLSGYHSRPVYYVDWCPLTDCVATACGDNSIRIFRQNASNVEPNQTGTLNFDLLDTIRGAHSQDVNCVKFHPKIAGVLASCSDDGRVKFWQIDCENYRN